MKKLFTVVIPLYNKEAFVRRCVDSVLSQTETNYELIVVNDGSTDGGVSVISSYDDKRIKIINQDNEGVACARNRGILESSSEWVAFLDADDYWLSEHLEELKKLIENYSDVGIVSTKSTELKVSQYPVPLVTGFSWERKKIDYYRFSSLNSGYIHSSSIAVKRVVFDDVGYFKNLKQGEDTELVSRICLSWSCAFSEKPTSFYCRGTGGIMETRWTQNTGNDKAMTSISDIGAAVSFLVDELEAGNVSQSLQNSVAIFINSRITTALKIKLYSGRTNGMFVISEFYISPLSFRCYMWRKIARLPDWLLIGFYMARSFVRSLYRKLMDKI